MLKCRSNFQVVVGTGREISRLARRLEKEGLKDISYEKPPVGKAFSSLKIFKDGEFAVSGNYRDLIVALTNGGFDSSSVRLEEECHTPMQIIKMYHVLFVRKGENFADKYWHWKEKVLRF